MNLIRFIEKYGDGKYKYQTDSSSYSTFYGISFPLFSYEFMEEINFFDEKCSNEIREEFKSCDELKGLDVEFVRPTYINDQQQPVSTEVFRFNIGRMKAYKFGSPFRIYSLKLIDPETIEFRIGHGSIIVDQAIMDLFEAEEKERQNKINKQISQAEKAKHELEKALITLSVEEKQFALYNGLSYATVDGIQAIKEAFAKSQEFTWLERLKSAWCLLWSDKITPKLTSRVLKEVNDELGKMADELDKYAETAIPIDPSELVKNLQQKVQEVQRVTMEEEATKKEANLTSLNNKSFKESLSQMEIELDKTIKKLAPKKERKKPVKSKPSKKTKPSAKKPTKRKKA